MDFQTPLNVCDYMTSLVPKGARNVLEPTPGEGYLVKALRANGLKVIAPENFFEVSGWFDCIVMNPPFSPMQMGYDILFKCFEMSDHIIALMPWLTIINSKNRTRQINEFGLAAVTHLPRSVFPGSRVQTCILELERDYNNDTLLRFY